MNLESMIRTIPDFPRKGIMFKDVTTLLKNKLALAECINLLAGKYMDDHIDLVAAMEARGFILGGALAVALGTGFVPLRKPGKLPAKVYSAEYDLEYGTDKLEMHQDGVSKGERVLIVDDLLATGGTAKAAVSLIEKSGGTVHEIAFLIELKELDGRRKLEPYTVFSLIKA